MTTIQEDVKEIILNFPLNIPRTINSVCELRIPGLPNITTEIKISLDGRTLTFDIPETKITSTTPWVDFKNGKQGQLVDEENYGEALGKTNKNVETHLKGCLIREKCWKEYPVETVTSKDIHFNELTVEPENRQCKNEFIESYIISGFDLPYWPELSETNDPQSGSFEQVWDRITLITPRGSCYLKKMNQTYTRFLFANINDKEFSNEVFFKDILPLLSFLNGRRVFLCKKELFTKEGNLIKETYIRNLSPKDHPIQYIPIPLNPDHESQVIYQLSTLFTQLCVNYLDWKTKIFIDEAIFHLHSALTSALESKFSVLSICFETLSSSYSRYKNGDKNKAPKYLDDDLFNENTKEIFELFKKSFKPILSVQDYESMGGKLRGINNRSMTSNFKKLLSDFNVTLSKYESDVLEKRNSAIHNGVLVRDREKINWQEVISYEGCMLTIINRLILRIFKYENKTLDYGSAGYPERNI